VGVGVGVGSGLSAAAASDDLVFIGNHADGIQEIQYRTADYDRGNNLPAELSVHDFQPVFRQSVIEILNGFCETNSPRRRQDNISTSGFDNLLQQSQM
jgi:hypothetical protein